MAPLNTRTAAVIEPILSTHARGYRNSDFISHLLFPRVTIPHRHMRVLKFGKESFRMMNTRRAPGANKKQVQYGYASDPVSLVQDVLVAKVPFEFIEEARVPNVDLAAINVNMVLNVIDLGHEYEAAQIARAAANYGVSNRVALAGGDRWSSDTSDPAADIEEGANAIRRMTGRRPNTLVLGPSAFSALCNHPKIIERFKYTSSASLTAEMLAAHFKLKRVIVGDAVFLPETADDNQSASDVWGDDAVLAYVPEGGDNFQVPGYGYTYDLQGYPQVMAGVEDRINTDSWLYDVKVERRVVLTGADAGFLFQNAGAA